MRATRTPIACTFAWLTVLTLFISAAPARCQALIPQMGIEVGLVSSKARCDFDTVDIVDQKPLSSSQLIKVWQLLGSFEAERSGMPRFVGCEVSQVQRTEVRLNACPRRIGIIELQV